MKNKLIFLYLKQLVLPLNSKFTLVIIITAVILLSSLVHAQDVEAYKSIGKKNPEVLSKKVCGLDICQTPMTIQEKIHLYLSKLLGENYLIQQSRFAMIGITHQ